MMTYRTSTRRRRPPHPRRSGPPAVIDGIPAAVDLLRADLYRILDEIAHASDGGHHALLMQFECRWEQFKDVIRRRG
jgi:hypothetical protein